MNIIGIYKITSPTNKVYIGQSVNIRRRWIEHKRLNLKLERKLKNSLEKYGVDNHIFEIIEECCINTLKDREAYWQDYYDSVNNGLNCVRTNDSNRSGYLCEETKRKISESRKANPNVNEKKKGVPLSEEHKFKIGLGNRGKIKTSETREKISKNRKGKYLGKNHHNYGGTLNEKSRKAFSERMKNLKGLENPSSKEVLDLNTGIFYYSIREAIKYNSKLSYQKLLGTLKNNTSLVIAEDYANNKIKEFIKKKNTRNSKKITDGKHEYISITEYSKINNTTRAKVYIKIKNKEIKYV